MKLNDRMLTVVTGVLLAIGGGAASLLLGDGGDTGPVQVAALDLAAQEAAEGGGAVLSDAGRPLDAAPKARAPVPSRSDMPPGEGSNLEIASVEPAARRQGQFRDQIRGRDGDGNGDRGQGAGGTIRVQDSVSELGALAQIADIRLPRFIPAPRAPSVSRVAAVEPSFGAALTTVSLPSVPAVDCALDIRATRLAGARVRLSLTAPCHPGVVATIEHAGLRFKERLDRVGNLSLKIPVFERFARFDIRLSDGTRATVGAFIADLSSVDRVGLGFAGAEDIFLHGRAARGDMAARHIWRDAPRSFARARAQGGGYLTVLGNPDLPEAELVQVLTLPQTATNAGRHIAVEVESRRPDCTGLGLTIVAHSPRGRLSARRMRLTDPLCGPGGSLVLKNIVKDLNVAAR